MLKPSCPLWRLFVLRIFVAHSARDFWQTRKDGGILQPCAMIDGWGAAYECASGNVACDSALGRDDRVVSHLAVSDDTHLAREDDAVADLGGSGESDL